MRLFSRSADAIVGRFFEGATAMEQTYTGNSFYGSVTTETILKVPSQERSSAWASRTPFVPMCCHGRTRAGVPKVDASGLQGSGARSTSWCGCWGWRAFLSRWRWRGWRALFSAGERWHGGSSCAGGTKAREGGRLMIGDMGNGSSLRRMCGGRWRWGTGSTLGWGDL